MVYLMYILFLSVSFASAHHENLPKSCESPIYCYGDLLEQVQLARVFNDGKTFVDLKMKTTEKEILEKFSDLQKTTGNNPNKQNLTNFIDTYFEKGNELVEYNITDFKKDPKFVASIKNETVKTFAQNIINIWPSLGRRVKQDVFENRERYSLIPVPNGFVVPGGRFQEYYYWDSYWIIDGLLLNEMHETSKGMIENFLHLVKEIGFIPNGGRVYYLQRSQPPLLTPMAYLYYEATHDLQWVAKHIDVLAKELSYWEGQAVDISLAETTHHLYRYYAASTGPRPESYREDYLTAAVFEEEHKQNEVYTDLKSGAESGWDFSNRWIFDGKGGNSGNLSNIQTRRVIPVDLNSFLCLSFTQISNLYHLLGNHNESLVWKKKAVALQTAISEVLWDPKDGIWHDYDLQLKAHRRKFYPSNLTPLWAKCIQEPNAPLLGESALKYLQTVGALDYKGGVPNSLDSTGLQWDFPNAWALLQDLVVRGLKNSNYLPAQNEAEVLAKRWVEANLIGYQNTGEMFEKYDAVNVGQYGGGGEYEVQPGFGFTNGVALRFINDYYTK